MGTGKEAERVGECSPLCPTGAMEVAATETATRATIRQMADCQLIQGTRRQAEFFIRRLQVVREKWESPTGRGSLAHMIAGIRRGTPYKRHKVSFARNLSAMSAGRRLIVARDPQASGRL